MKTILQVNNLTVQNEKGILFDKAKIPLTKSADKKQHMRARELPTDDSKQVVEDVNNALNSIETKPAK